MTVLRPALLALLLSGCGFVHEETLVARYKLVAGDVRQDMLLCWSMDSGDCSGDGLFGPTLFAAGYNDKYVVGALHPNPSGGGELRRDITQYFYVVRDLPNENKDFGMPYNGVKGLFSEAEFEAERARLGLPAFSRVFNDLK